MELNPTDLARLKGLTSRNNHSAALVLAAKMLGLTAMMRKFELVDQLIKLEGHKPKNLSDYSYALYEQLIEQAKRSLSPEDYEQFYRSM